MGSFWSAGKLLTLQPPEHSTQTSLLKITAAQFQARNSPLHLCTATEVRGHEGQTNNRTYEKLPQVQWEACLVFLLPIPVFSTGVAESLSDCTVAENAERPAATSLISKSSLLLLSKFSSFFFRNTAYLTLCPDDIWLAAVHWESTEWTAFANFIIAEMVTNHSGLAGDSTVRKSHSTKRLMTSNRNLWFLDSELIINSIQMHAKQSQYNYLLETLLTIFTTTKHIKIKGSHEPF